MFNPIQYDYKEFDLADGKSDYDVSEEVLELFSNVTVARRVIIKTNKSISFKFNNTNLSAISLDIGDSPFQMPEDFMEVNNIFLTNDSGATAAIKIWLV